MVGFIQPVAHAVIFQLCSCADHAYTDCLHVGLKPDESGLKKAFLIDLAHPFQPVLGAYLSLTHITLAQDTVSVNELRVGAPPGLRTQWYKHIALNKIQVQAWAVSGQFWLYLALICSERTLRAYIPRDTGDQSFWCSAVTESSDSREVRATKSRPGLGTVPRRYLAVPT